MSKPTSFIVCALAAALLLHGVAEATIISSFATADVSDDGSGLTASAKATVTTGPGYIEILLQNTSERQDNFKDSGLSANPFITELQVSLASYTIIAADSHIRSVDGALFAQGAGNEAITLDPRNLSYKVMVTHSPGMDPTLLFGEADNKRNDNTLASISALDANGVPQEGYAGGFLNPSPNSDSGAIFDSALFHFALDTTDTPDENSWTDENTLVVKFQGGGYSRRVHNPEPATMCMLAVGGLTLLRRRRRA
ncbi:MAG: PEP-CTERM sorting domain-containing protein [Phycisphaerae bacterium]|nr:PEP-CTERM sorting domain-containing protein [Phycisphaerae bacterium]